MHPEHAPSPGDDQAHAQAHAPSHAEDEAPGRDPSRRQPDAPATTPTPTPTSPEEREALHTCGVDPPVDRSMLDAVGADAEPASATTPVASAETDSAPDINLPAGDGAAAPEAIKPRAGSLAKRKKKRRRRSPRVFRTVINPPFPLSPLAQKFWDRLTMSMPHLWYLATYFKVARYCTLLAAWVEISQVLSTKGMVYVKHARDNSRVDAIRIMPHADYFIRIEYALQVLERELGLDPCRDAEEYRRMFVETAS